MPGVAFPSEVKTSFVGLRQEMPAPKRKTLQSMLKKAKPLQNIAVATKTPSLESEIRENVNAAPKPAPTFKKYKGPGGRSYYCNTSTGDVSWGLPEGGIVLDPQCIDAVTDTSSATPEVVEYEKPMAKQSFRFFGMQRVACSD